LRYRRADAASQLTIPLQGYECGSRAANTVRQSGETATGFGCRSVAFTYDDPVILLEYAVDTAKACHAAGLKTVAVTAGYVAPDARREFFAHMDAANVDLKAFTEDFYRTVCGGHLEGMLDTLVYLRQEIGVWFEITTLLIPGETRGQCVEPLGDSKSQARRTAAFHGVSPRLEDARQASNSDCDVVALVISPAPMVCDISIPAMSTIGRAAADGAMAAERC